MRRRKLVSARIAIGASYRFFRAPCLAKHHHVRPPPTSSSRRARARPGLRFASPSRSLRNSLRRATIHAAQRRHHHQRDVCNAQSAESEPAVGAPGQVKQAECNAPGSQKSGEPHGLHPDGVSPLHLQMSTNETVWSGSATSSPLTSPAMGTPINPNLGRQRATRPVDSLPRERTPARLLDLTERVQDHGLHRISYACDGAKAREHGHSDTCKLPRPTHNATKAPFTARVAGRTRAPSAAILKSSSTTWRSRSSAPRPLRSASP